jgi:hypothetical protein
MAVRGASCAHDSIYPCGREKEPRLKKSPRLTCQADGFPLRKPTLSTQIEFLAKNNCKNVIISVGDMVRSQLKSILKDGSIWASRKIFDVKEDFSTAGALSMA